MQPTEQEGLKRVCSDLSDDLRRLEFADWLEEQGLVGRAEFIRTQIELAAPLSAAVQAGVAEVELRARASELRDREAQLVQNHSVYELSGLPQDCPARLNYRTGMHRGFMRFVDMRCEQWLAWADRIAWRPTWTDICPKCLGEKRDRWTPWTKDEEYGCRVCRGKGRIPRPCVAEQPLPLEMVQLRGWWPGFSNAAEVESVGRIHRRWLKWRLRQDEQKIRGAGLIWFLRKLFRAEWPGIRFVFVGDDL